MTGIARRVATLPVVMLFVSAVVFVAIHALPGDPARLMAGPRAPRRVIDAGRYRDHPMIQGVTLLSIPGVLGANPIADRRPCRNGAR